MTSGKLLLTVPHSGAMSVVANMVLPQAVKFLPKLVSELTILLFVSLTVFTTMVQLFKKSA